MISTIFKKIDSKIPFYIRKIIDPEKGSINKFISDISKNIGSNKVVLDAGAGSCPYKKYFGHTMYESTDFEDIFDKSSKSMHSFICNLEKIPKNDNSYDVIINTQVLEHVENPQKVICEFYRILKENGELYLTAPLLYGVHGKPYNYFNFTNYGLKTMFEKAGFNIIYIKPRGGLFWQLSKEISIMLSYIYSQRKMLIEKIALFPFYVVSLLFCKFLIPFILYFLDSLDNEKEWTLGYECYCIKK
ncbi:Methyltransferase type 11 [Methanococcus vannielii SB]|uniref:Methyltransferase type 11 n=1 Tax=Methanococcus vannielii (strain ATCC 35089 / DSM 1224 / JCM 13029 / OCM 148 / SB) TaxID=406327 RepID=A6UP92_METVS|nr:class I SAM-dependent methyltransferase [Methanococcus vannielii]ABR54314.1 Methyltransferase type 11 [Methanococcus vannielii SB]